MVTLIAPETLLLVPLITGVVSFVSPLVVIDTVASVVVSISRVLVVVVGFPSASFAVTLRVLAPSLRFSVPLVGVAVWTPLYGGDGELSRLHTPVLNVRTVCKCDLGRRRDWAGGGN